MSLFSTLFARVRQGQGRYRFLQRLAKAVLDPRAPRVPSILKPFLRLLYEGRAWAMFAGRFLVTFLIRHPLFQARCKVVGRNLVLGGPMPWVAGPVEIELGDNVFLGGKMAILSGGPVPNPRLVIKDRSAVGWNSIITVGKEVIIEEDVIIAYDCRISDTDGHPKQADLRASHIPPPISDVRPVLIRRNVWIGNGCHIMKGVTVGEGAVIGSNSVVISDIPPYSLALGNPAEVYFRNYGKPSKKNPPPSKELR